MELSKSCAVLTRRRHFASVACGILSSPLLHRIYLHSGQTLILPADYHAAGKPAAFLSDDGATSLFVTRTPARVRVQRQTATVLLIRNVRMCCSVTVDGLNYSRFEKQMPELATFAEQKHRLHPSYEFGIPLITVFSACSMAYRRAIWMACYPPERLRAHYRVES
ncbi:hypothetical protein KCP75_11490 [Salmonella enterica subsp. enterica]|nr:hypothetical protein KCP75_11490 [Salmonella enterica subsp. enterica]